jgi:hypothetical protein
VYVDVVTETYQDEGQHDAEYEQYCNHDTTAEHPSESSSFSVLPFPSAGSDGQSSKSRPLSINPHSVPFAILSNSPSMPYCLYHQYSPKHKSTKGVHTSRGSQRLSRIRPSQKHGSTLPTALPRHRRQFVQLILSLNLLYSSPTTRPSRHLSSRWRQSLT